MYLQKRVFFSFFKILYPYPKATFYFSLFTLFRHYLHNLNKKILDLFFLNSMRYATVFSWVDNFALLETHRYAFS
jgi:hypothetical protein